MVKYIKSNNYTPHCVFAWALAATVATVGTAVAWVYIVLKRSLSSLLVDVAYAVTYWSVIKAVAAALLQLASVKKFIIHLLDIPDSVSGIESHAGHFVTSPP